MVCFQIVRQRHCRPVYTLLDNASLPANVLNVPDTGSVNEVVLVVINVVANAPDVTSEPPSVIVLPVLATPSLPPFARREPRRRSG